MHTDNTSEGTYCLEQEMIEQAAFEGFVWTTRDGRKLRPESMSSDHLKNAINLFNLPINHPLQIELNSR